MARMPFSSGMRDRSTDIPYAWYWRGKSLRKGRSLGDKIWAIQVPSHPPTGDTCSHAPSVLTKPACEYLQTSNCNGCHMGVSCKDFDTASCRECSQSFYHYRSSSIHDQVSHCCCSLSGNYHTSLPRFSEPIRQPISDRTTSYTSDYHHPSDRYWVSASSPVAYDYPLAGPNPTPCPMSPDFGTVYSHPPPTDTSLGQCQYIHDSPHLQENKTSMRQKSPTAARAYSGPCTGEYNMNAYSFEDPDFCEGKTERSISIGGSSSDDRSTKVENQSYHRPRPRASRWKYRPHQE